MEIVKRLALRILRESLFPLILLSITLVLCMQNYTPNTFLSGWDTLHPEFDFNINTIRTLFGVFRPEQGLGAVAAHAHMVELPRILILYILHFVFPISLLRYLYIFICLALGPIGIYLFLNKILIKQRLPSFLGALFYLLNLGTYQTFLVPFEMFTTLYAALPFVFLTISEYLRKPSKKILLLFSVVIIFTAPAAYASALWFVFFASLILFFTPFIFTFQSEKKQALKRFVILLTIILFLNSYWLLPNIYFALSQGSQVANASINKLFSESAFLKNKEFGNIKDILLLKSFYFDWGIFNVRTGGFEQLTQAFQNHLANPVISAIGYIFSSIFISGFFGMYKRGRRYLLSTVFLTVFCVIFLSNDNQPFTAVFRFLQVHVPLFKEAFRFPDDKILNVYIFLVTILFSYSFFFLFSFLKKGWLRLLLQSVIGIIISLLLFIYMLPAFSGKFISPFVRIHIPVEYFELFDSLKSDTTGRVANLPVNSPWGWVYQDWYGAEASSFQGAGFMYFGVTPSLMDRDFDRWNPLNEQYYREISHAVYSNNPTVFKKVLEKYDIDNVLLDTSVISPGTDEKSLYYEQLAKLLEKLRKDSFFTSKKTFGLFLTLYSTKPRALIGTLKSTTTINELHNSYYVDTAYSQFKDYISKPSSTLTYPLVDISDNESKIMPNIVKTTDTSLTFQLQKGTYRLYQNSYSQPIIPTTIVATIENLTDEKKLNISLYPQTPLLNNSSLLAPIKGDFNYPSSTNALLSVNRQVYDLKSVINENPTAIGSVFLNTNVNNIALFDRDAKTTDYSVSDIPFSFGYCTGGNNSNLSILTHQDSLILTKAAGNSVCIKIPLSFIKTPANESTTLVSVNFTADQSNLESICLTNPINGSCLEYLKPEGSNKNKTVKFAINKNDLSTTQLVLTVSKNSQEQAISQLSVSSIQAISETLLDSSFFKYVTPLQFQNLTLPKIVDTNYYLQANATTSTVNDCKNEPNTSSKEFVKKDQMYQYSSDVGSYCDHISFPNLPHSLAYLVYVKSKNEVGLPMNFCVTNYTSRRCDIYSQLSKFKTPQNDIFLLPQSDENGSGFDINFENVGIEGSPAVNDFYSVTFVPFPLDLLSHVQKGAPDLTNYSGVLTSQKVYNPLFMTASVKNSPTLITLSYAYNSGFHAYVTTCTHGFTCIIRNFLSPIFGHELQHLKISSWKNGWLMPHEGSIVIIFIPQYLEYIGLAIFILTLLMLIITLLFNTNKSRQLAIFFEKKSLILKYKIDRLISSS